MIDDTPTAMVAYGIQGMDEGERLMREGRIMAIVQIPAFFEKNILSNSQTRPETIHKNGRKRNMPRMSKKRKHELSFYLNDRGRVTYNELCRIRVRRPD